MKVEIWRVESGACLLLEDLSFSEASVLTSNGACVVEAREVGTSAEGIQWFTQWCQGQQLGVEVEEVGRGKLQEKAVEMFVAQKGGESS